MPSEVHNNPDGTYFEYSVICGTFKGLKARWVGQPSQTPEYADVELRDGRIVRGPIRLPLSSLKWVGPQSA